MKKQIKKNEYFPFSSRKYSRSAWHYFLFLHCLIQVQCQDGPAHALPVYHYNPPKYHGISLLPSQDTIRYALDETTYNQIKSSNIFQAGKSHCIAFYDQRSQTIITYDFYTCAPIRKISLKKFFPKTRLYKTKVYFRNFDSIFVTNQTTLYLFDSNGTLKNSIDFLDEPPNAWASLENTMPPILIDQKLYAGVSPYVEETSLKALSQWRVLYEFDLQKGQPKLHYSLPAIYKKDLYGYHFLDYNYCFTKQGNFVFSFPADTNIYETDLRNYHRSYYAKSRFQADPISPVNKKALQNKEGYKLYKLSDSYGPIIFDPYNRRYLRLAKRKISEADFDNKKTDRKESVIIFNEHFTIIGEEEKPDSYNFNSIFFGPDGKMYARVNANDEYTLQFVQLIYVNNENIPLQLSRK